MVTLFHFIHSEWHCNFSPFPVLFCPNQSVASELSIPVNTEVAVAASNCCSTLSQECCRWFPRGNQWLRSQFKNNFWKWILSTVSTHASFIVTWSSVLVYFLCASKKINSSTCKHIEDCKGPEDAKTMQQVSQTCRRQVKCLQGICNQGLFLCHDSK